MLKIMGKSQASIEQMRAYIRKMNPKVSDSVIKMIPLYITEGVAEGVRGDVHLPRAAWKPKTSHSANRQ